MKNFGKIIVLLLTLSVTALSGVSQVIPARTASSPSLDSLLRMSRFTRYMYDGAGNRIQRQTNSSLSPVMVSPQPEMQELQDFYGSSPVSVPVEKVKIFDFGVLPDSQERPGVSVADLSDPRERAQVLFASSANSEIADIDTSLPVGKIPVTEDVTATGARVYSVPIATAAGFRLTPQVGLVYSSHSGQGPAGYGWNISGLSAVTVTGKSLFYHGETAPATVGDDETVYSLDGKPLLAITESEYYPQGFDLQPAGENTVLKKHVDENGIVTHFTALYPDGIKAVFGFPDNTEAGYMFPITECSDIFGNKVEFEYLPYGTSSGNKYYISSIKYGFDVADNPAGVISFEYSAISGYPVQYLSGIPTQHKYLLQSVTSSDGDTEIVEYSLTHELQDGDCLLTLISSISENEELNPLQFVYGDPDTPSSGTFSPVDTVALPQLFEIGRENFIFRSGKLVPGNYGDAMVALPNYSTYAKVAEQWNSTHTERYYKYGSTYDANQIILVYPTLNGKSSLQTITADVEFQGIEVMDIDADGTDEIIKLNFAGCVNNQAKLKITIYEYSGTSLRVRNTFTVSVTGVIPDGFYTNPIERFFWYGNFKGDGTVQLVSMNASRTYRGNYTPSRAAVIDLNTGQRLSENNLFDINTRSNTNSVFSYDIDGDGMTELCHANYTGMDVYKLSGNTFIKDRTIPGFDVYDLPGYSDTLSQIHLTDLNGDGYQEIVRRTGRAAAVFTFTGDEFTRSELTLSGAFSPGDRYAFYDLDRDGLADLVHASGSNYYFTLNDAGIIDYTKRKTTSIHYDDKVEFLPFNTIDNKSLGNFITVSGDEIFVYDFTRDRRKDRLVTMFSDSHGKVTVNDYADISLSSADIYGYDSLRTYGSGFARRNYPLYVLRGFNTYGSSDISTDNRLRSVKFMYYDAVFGRSGLGFCGFGKVRQYDYVVHVWNDIVTETEFDPEHFGVTKEVLRYYVRTPENLIYEQTDSYDFSDKFRPLLKQTLRYDLLTGERYFYSYQYGKYGLPYIVTLGRPVGLRAIWQEVTTYTFSHTVSDTLYRLGTVVKEDFRKTKDGAPASWNEVRTYQYDSRFLPVKETCSTGRHTPYSADLARVYDKVWTYDSFGNPLSEKQAVYNSTAYVGDTYTYGNDGRFMLTHTDALGLTETYGDYNKFGKPETVTDSKNRTTTHSYDNWGNLLCTAYPDGTKDSVSVQWGGAGVYTVSNIRSGQPETRVHYDAADRELRRGEKRYDGTWVWSDTEYDVINGKVSRESYPYREDSTKIWINHGYDIYGRITSTWKQGTGYLSSYSYGNLYESETTGGITTETHYNIDGTVDEVVDNGISIQYYYNPVGALCDSVVCGGRTIAFEYDRYGNRYSITDPSAGRQTDTTAYLPSGASVTTHINPNGKIIVYTDSLGRTTKTDRTGEFVTEYFYDDYGLLMSEISSNGTSVTYSYDAFDRVSSVTDSVPDGKWLRKDYTYGADGNVSTIKYTSQDGEIDTEHYLYANGHNVAVLLAGGQTVWRLTSENEFGQPLSGITGEVTRTYAYSEDGNPTERSMGTVQAFGYVFDALKGNLMSRTDLNRSSTESFTYDTDNRLFSFSGKEVQYHENGGISYIEGVGSMFYTGDKVSSILTEDETLIPDRRQTISYTCYSRPSVLSEGGRSAAFTYNGNGDRVRMLVTEDSDTLFTRYYIGDNYEIDVEDGTVTQRLYAGGTAYSAPMVLVKEGNGSWIPYNIGRDYLGSITHIATVDGILVAEYSYDPWGRLRNPETLVPYKPGEEPDLMLGRGFGGHEHLTWFGLINMNARLYDPLLGRFVSPDPFVQMTERAANFNRYLYGLNNPFSYVDESGEFFITAIIVGAIIGAAIGVYEGYKIAEAKGATGWEKAGYMIGGGLIGGAGGALGGWAGAAAGAAVSVGGFIGGATAGGAAGAVTGFVNGFGMSMLNNPQDVGGAFWQGVYQSAIGGIGGAAVGGLVQGSISAINGNNFWNGSTPSSTSNKVDFTLDQPTSDQFSQHSVRDSYQKGIEGVNRAIDEYKAAGGEYLSKEVTLEVNGTRVRVDAAFDVKGEIVLVEVKNGPHARLTYNQSVVYPQMELGVPVIPRGSRAELVWPGFVGKYVDKYRFVIIKYK